MISMVPGYLLGRCGVSLILSLRLTVTDVTVLLRFYNDKSILCCYILIAVYPFNQINSRAAVDAACLNYNTNRILARYYIHIIQTITNISTYHSPAQYYSYPSSHQANYSDKSHR